MSALLPLPIVLPLLGAALALLLTGSRTAARVLSVTVTTATCAASVALLVAVQRGGGVAAVQVGGWPAPFGITLVADRLSAALLVVATLMVAAVLVYALAQLPSTAERLAFHPVYLVLTAGVCLSFLTGDLFTLFVGFEVMLTASYVLLTLGGAPAQVRAGMTYVVISLVASTLFVVAVAFVYAATGSVNLADLAGRLGEIPPALREALGLLLLVVFGVKAAIFPLFFWLPDSYPTAPTPVTAIFAGLLTKVGVYALIRTQTLLFADGGPSPLILAIAGATMLVGVLGAVAQDDIKRILSFHIVSQIGYMVLGLGLFTVAGVAGAVFYVLHHIVVKTALFLVAGLVERSAGTGALSRLSGLALRTPVTAVLFAVPALSLAGIPPFSGFVAKLSLAQAGFASGRYLVVGVSLLTSLLTLYSMAKIWAGAFWGAPEEAVEADGPPAQRARLPLAMTGATASLVVLSLAVTLGAGPLASFSRAAAEDLMARTPYVAAVLGDGATVAGR